MATNLDPFLMPRYGVTLYVLIVCRISGMNQDIKSLDDQEARAKDVVTGYYDGPIEWTVVSSRASGEYLDRRELTEIEAHLESRRFDLVVTEDLGRIARRTRAYDLCELAEDCGTRVLALNDSVDTGREGWQMNAFFSVVRHEMYNRDTAARIRRSLRNRFVQGGVIQFVIYGIVKPPGARTDADLSKDPEAGPVYDAWFRMLEEGASYGEVADMLNALGVRPGPCARSDRWTAHLVREVTFNPILKGVRVRNEKVSKRVNKTGRHRSVPAPPGERLERAVPHLAFIETARYDRVIALLKARNAKYRRNGADGRDARKDVPRKSTLWPGQHVTCGVCGRLYYYGGHGRKSHLMCSGNREYTCWSGVTFDGARAAEKLAAAVRAAVEALPGFDATFGERLDAEVETVRKAGAGRLDDLTRRERVNHSATGNIMATLRVTGPRPSLVEDLTRLDAERDRLLLERQILERLPKHAVALPSRDRLLELAGEAFAGLTHRSPEFGRLMRRLIPVIEVRPYQLVDGGGLVLRAHLTLDLVPLIPEATGLEGLCDLLRHDLTVDLFDMPQRAAYRERVLALKAQGRTENQIASGLGLTKTAVQRASSLDRKMRARGLTDPYVAVTEPPAGQRRMRRHQHPRFQFVPKPDGKDSPETQDQGPKVA